VIEAKRKEANDHFTKKIELLSRLQRERDAHITTEDSDYSMLPIETQTLILDFYDMQFTIYFPKLFSKPQNIRYSREMTFRTHFLTRLFFGFKIKDPSRTVHLLFPHVNIGTQKCNIFFGNGARANSDATKQLLLNSTLSALPCSIRSLLIEDVPVSMDRITRFSQLQSLAMESVPDVKVSNLERMSTLTSLVLAETPRHDRTNTPELSSFPNLRSFDFSQHERYDTDLFLGDLKDAPNLTYLNLESTIISNKGFKKILELKHIKIVNLLWTLVKWNIEPGTQLPATLKQLAIPEFCIKSVPLHENDFTMDHNLEKLTIQKLTKENQKGLFYFLNTTSLT
jgi:hypothetical protein